MRKGFTLIEMVIVIAVIAILAGLLVPMVGSILSDARVSAGKAECKQVATAILRYSIKRGIFPLASGGSNRGWRNGAQVLNPYLAGKYIDGQIQYDPWNCRYSYWVPSRTYASWGYPAVFYSNGPDRVNSSWNASLWRAGRWGGDDLGQVMGDPWGT